MMKRRALLYDKRGIERLFKGSYRRRIHVGLGLAVLTRDLVVVAAPIFFEG